MKPSGHSNPALQATGRWTGLRSRMTISYILVTVVTILILEFFVGAVVFGILHYSAVTDGQAEARASRTAQLYAQAAAAQADNDRLDPGSTFEPQQPGSLRLPEEQGSWNTEMPAHHWRGPMWSGPDWESGYSTVPYLSESPPDRQDVAIALLIAPDGQVIASSYPARYPTKVQASTLLPEKAELITRALNGEQETRIEVTNQGRIAISSAPIWKREKQVIGAIYVQFPPFIPATFPTFFTSIWLQSSIVWLLVTIPFGVLFGLVTTRGLIRRIQRLDQATERFARGQYDQRIPVKQKDELGHLEYQLNSMADQLVESLARQRLLTEQYARLEERARIARELHDSVKQQLFAVSMQIGTALSLLDSDQNRVRRHLSEADTLAYQSQQELTALIRELRPSPLQQQHFSDALGEYVRTWSRQNEITANLDITNECSIPPALEEALLRITQEGLANVARHSQATQVQITLICSDEQVRLSLSDNGRGFDTTARYAGMGLSSMKERMEALGGTLTIQSTEKQGTQIIAQCHTPIVAKPQGVLPERKSADDRLD
jgi:NarL family two-component system sensor histidine kinase LiaS